MTYNTYMEKDLYSYVMVGAPGAGKSTYAKKLAETENAVIISGDDVRQELYGDSSVQGSWIQIWDRIEELVSGSCGMSVILDGTHYRKDYREEAITLLRSFGYLRVEAVVVNPSLPACLARNFQRKRHVPDYVIKEMHEKLQTSLKTIDNEDFDRITYVL
jgi:predicted kinase